MNNEIKEYIDRQETNNKSICELLNNHINEKLSDITESKVWHGSPVWFINGNPIVGYGVLKDCVRLLFWSGQSFNESGLKPEGSFKASEARYTNISQVNMEDLDRWLEKSIAIQWDYKNIVKKRGVLERLK